MIDTQPETLPKRLSDLTRDEQCLLRKIQQLHFGRVRNVTIRGGKPVLTRQVRFEKLYKLGNRNDAREEFDLPDFTLKSEVIDMIRAFRRMGEGRVLLIEVRDGLPFSILDSQSISEPAA